MGLFRKAAYLASGGIVAPHSRSRKTQLQTLAAIQGASPQQVRATGGRHDFDSVVSGTPRVVPSPAPAAARPAKGSKAEARAAKAEAARQARKTASNPEGKSFSELYREARHQC